MGLGNPGLQYAHTRHNVGFMVASELLRRWSLAGGRERFLGRLVEGSVGGPADERDPDRPRRRVAVLCPHTYMNEAGRSVGPARGALRVPLERVLVVHDEIDLPFGDVRTRTGGGLAGHNGLKSLRQGLGSGEFMRVRVGVGRPDSTDPEIVSAYVLGRFDENEEEVAALVRTACEEVDRVVFGGQGSQ